MFWFSVALLAIASADLAVEPWNPPAAAVAAIREQIPRDAPPLVRLRLLHQFLISPRGLGVRQVADWSGSSSEVWRQRRADCVGFAYLFGGLARELSIDVSFVMERRWQAPTGRTVRMQRGLRVKEAHVSLLYEPKGGRPWLIDHAGFRRAPGTTHRLLDSEAAALLPANRGARAFIAGDCTEARAQARRAWQEAPFLGELARNLRAIERRCSIGI